jgi:hypothetical protein
MKNCGKKIAYIRRQCAVSVMNSFANLDTKIQTQVYHLLLLTLSAHILIHNNRTASVILIYDVGREQ